MTAAVATFVPTISFREGCAEKAFTAASHLTTPLCKTRELYVRLKYADRLDPTVDRVTRLG